MLFIVLLQSEPGFIAPTGCNVSRLKDFITDFYAHNASHTQTLDDPFFSFVWSLVAGHPTVLIGLKDPKVKSEVWIAPQNCDKRKAKAHGGDQPTDRSATLQPIPQPKTTPLETLQEIHGDKLRIALEPSAIVAAITGSHIRVRSDSSEREAEIKKSSLSSLRRSPTLFTQCSNLLHEDGTQGLV